MSCIRVRRHTGLMMAAATGAMALGCSPAKPPAPPPPTPPQLAIVDPAGGGKVAWNPIVQGQAKGAVTQVWLKVHPMATTQKCWIQGGSQLKPGQAWNVYAQLGEPNRNIGEAYEVTAFADPQESPDSLPAGPDGSVDCGFKAGVWSPPVVVFRK